MFKKIAINLRKTDYPIAKIQKLSLRRNQLTNQIEGV